MSTPFAAAQARLNTAKVRHLANASGTVGGIPFTGCFTADWSPHEALGLSIGGTRPAVEMLQSDVPTDWVGASLFINAGDGVGDYTVRELHPDGTGWATLVLEALP